MNKQIIEIEVPEGKKAIWKDGKVVFEDIATKLPETWEEFCELYPIKEEECYIDDCSVINEKNGLRARTADQNVLPSREAAEAYLALMQLHQLRDCYRQGWVPDYKRLDYKYCICNDGNNYVIVQIVDRSRFLTFKSKEIAEKFLTNFEYLIEQAGDLI